MPSNRVRFWQNTGARGALRVREDLRGRGVSALRLNQNASKFRGKRNDIIINWGSQVPIPSSVIGQAVVYNRPEAISNASNKLTALTTLHDNGMDAYVPQFTSDIEEAREMVEDGSTIYCRTKLSASQGRGIVIATTPEEVADARLYTELVPHSREVRIHVFNGNVIDYAQKKRMSSERREEEGIGESNDLIRNYENGYIFARDNVSIPEEAKEVAIRAIEVLGLHFGSVDMILREGDEHPIILEVNTASGMEGTTVSSYAEAIRNMLG